MKSIVEKITIYFVITVQRRSYRPEDRTTSNKYWNRKRNGDKKFESLFIPVLLTSPSSGNAATRFPIDFLLGLKVCRRNGEGRHGKCCTNRAVLILGARNHNRAQKSFPYVSSSLAHTLPSPSLRRYHKSSSDQTTIPSQYLSLHHRRVATSSLPRIHTLVLFSESLWLPRAL